MERLYMGNVFAGARISRHTSGQQFLLCFPDGDLISIAIHPQRNTTATICSVQQIKISGSEEMLLNNKIENCEFVASLQSFSAFKLNYTTVRFHETRLKHLFDE